MYQLVNNGDVPDEDYFNNALMKQTVIVCTSGTRPSSPPHGMTVYETDTKSFRVWNSAAWVRTGAFDQENAGTGAATDSTAIGGITSTSFITGSPVNGFSFVAPPSGGVYVNVGGRISMTTNQNEIILSYEIRSGGTIGAGTIQVAGSSFRALTAGRAVNASAAAVINATRRVRHQAGTLTPGSTFNIQNLHMVTPAGTGTIDYRDLFIEPVL